MLGQDVIGLLVRAVQQVGHLLINLGGHGIRVVDGAAAGGIGEGIALLLAVLDGAQIRAEAVLSDHGARDLGGVLDIGGRTGGGCAEHELLRGTPAHSEDEASKQLIAGVHALVVFLRGHGVAAGAAAGQDGHLVDALDILQRPRGQSVAALVVSGDLLLVLGDDLALAARATDDAVGGLLQRVIGNDVATDAGGEQGGLVEYVGQVRAGHAGGALGQLRHVDLLGQRLVLGMHAQDLLAAGQVGVGHRDLAVEAARAQKRWVQDVGAVGRGDEDDAFTVTEAVHLHEQLV